MTSRKSNLLARSLLCCTLIRSHAATKDTMSSAAAAGGKVDAFALMRAAAKSKQKQPAAAVDPDDSDDDDTAMAGPSKGGKQPSQPAAPVFKGSGLGAGPRHVVDPGPSLLPLSSLAALLLGRL